MSVDEQFPICGKLVKGKSNVRMHMANEHNAILMEKGRR
jgi:hypothetical protein